jgi:2-amino-4-hydroxy-6-hydroxymethyldihydropteridine diphosphokinase
MTHRSEGSAAGTAADASHAPEADVYLGLGANLDDPAARLAEAVERLGRVLTVVAVSSVYRTEPVGHRDQPDFLNAVVHARTRLAPAEVLAACLRVEAEMGRVRTFANAPRRIDVDVLAHGDAVILTPSLALPHPRIAVRGFVLHPLAEVAPSWRHPVLGRTAAELLAAAGPPERVERAGPPPGPP